MGLAGLNAILFVSYGGLLRAFERQHQPSSAFDNNADFEPTLGQVYLAGCGAGIASFFFSTPTDLVKIQAQVSVTPKSSWQVTREIFSRNGIRGTVWCKLCYLLLDFLRLICISNIGFYQGGWITIIRDAPSYGIYFWVYEGMKRLLEVDQTQNTCGSNAWKLLLAGGAAGALSWTSIYPIDVVKSRLQMQVVPSKPSPSNATFSTPAPAILSTTKQQRMLHTTAIAGAEPTPLSSSTCPSTNMRSNTASCSAILDARPYASIRDCIVRSYKTDGAGVFFRGVGPTILRAFPVNAVTFYVYEVMMEFLDNWKHALYVENNFKKM